MHKTSCITVIVVLLCLASSFMYLAYRAVDSMEGMGKCGLSEGPIYGEPIDIEPSIADLDQLIEVGIVKLGFMNLRDSLAPKMIKYDKDNNVLWAIEFKKTSEAMVPATHFSDMTLTYDNGVLLTFFNHSHGEPGRIYLTNRYDFKYMCLSIM